MSALKLIYAKLLEGESFGTVEPHRQGGTFFWDVLSADNTYIYWRCYGQSANKTSLQNLKWIIREIFRMTPEEFLYTYMTYSKYKEINKYYKGA